ncbi:MAG: DUF1523 family protein [Pseudomonadota bacterium]|nr:DUF1523 family protein [Pseudomonadota bacterium]
MRKLIWGLAGLVVLVFGLVLEYSLPQHDIVRIVGTDVKRMDVGERSWFWAEPDATTGRGDNRDVRFVNAATPDGDAYVYRNEDTNWSYPPYFKFESGSLNARAQALISTEAQPIWAVVTHYGWRIELFTMFPNVVDIRRAEGPDEFIFPWFNTIFLLLLGTLFILIGRTVMRLRRRYVDPVQEDIEEFVSETTARSDAAVNRARGRWTRWLGTWKSKPKRRY